MALQIESTKGVGTKSVKIQIYGASGVGKTRLALTCPKPIILSNESGLLSLRDSDIPYVTIKSRDMLKVAMQQFSRSPDYETIVLDSLTDLADLIFLEEAEKNKDPRVLYPEVLRLVKGFVSMCRNINKHIIFICKEERIKTADGSFVYGPIFPGNKLADEITYLLDEVFRMVKNDKGSFLLCNKRHDFIAKDRSGALKTVEKPDISAIISKIKGDLILSDKDRDNDILSDNKENDNNPVVDKPAENKAANEW